MRIIKTKILTLKEKRMKRNQTWKVETKSSKMCLMISETLLNTLKRRENQLESYSKSRENQLKTIKRWHINNRKKISRTRIAKTLKKIEDE